MADIVMRRVFKPWFHPDWLFRLLPLAKEHAKYLSTLHNMTKTVIRIRKDGCVNTVMVADHKDIGNQLASWLLKLSDLHFLCYKLQC